jgi:hypothetical protein
MSQWKNIASVVALSISTALAGTGCVAHGADDESANEPEGASTTPVQNTTTAEASDRPGEERTGEADQACFFGTYFGGFGFNPFPPLLITFFPFWGSGFGW